MAAREACSQADYDIQTCILSRTHRFELTPLLTLMKPVLYVYPPSVWATVPELALIELGYAPGAVLRQVVDLSKGENLGPDFYKVTKHATLPVLEADGKHYTSTIEVTKYFVEHAPSPGKTGKHQAVIDAVHAEELDPNFAKIAARCENELGKKQSIGVSRFVSGRHAAAVKYAASQPEMKAFYESKLPQLKELDALFSGTASAEEQQAFFQQSNEHWKKIDSFIWDKLPSYLPRSGFIEGPGPGEADFHVAAWLARIVDCCVDTHSTNCNDDMQALAKELGDEVPEEVERYWTAWGHRESWKTVYRDGLH
ncbi:hypothetical protein CALVIDRAFT_598557 [Calocera viscosa TUFC12733]|uniref:GST N-terminal domain-containing protein n=1 Tax=Calocera viscosa (strain TUFC12733) TaxID=1330018 RepID=A0A167M1Q7_CALVF|nr:hypothetical protein CALVIDRAFT_598557 [Calocera viscosa TUFC12733]